eukprot:Skav210003  [mRNA]  locus=scaffold3061:150530:153108:- [translate_table: standard]
MRCACVACQSAQQVDPIVSHPDVAPTHALRFPQRVAKLLLEVLPSSGRVLDIGCAVGGSSFEIAAAGHEVLGVDFSQAFIDAAERMKNGEARTRLAEAMSLQWVSLEAIRFKVPLEGELEAEVTAQHEANVDAAARERVESSGRKSS